MNRRVFNDRSVVPGTGADLVPLMEGRQKLQAITCTGLPADMVRFVVADLGPSNAWSSFGRRSSGMCNSSRSSSRKSGSEQTAQFS